MIHFKLPSISKQQVQSFLENLYLLFFSILMVYAFLQTTTFEIEWSDYFVWDIRALLIAVIILRYLLNEKYDWKELAFIFMICVGMLWAYRRNSYEEIYSCLLLMIGAKDISFRKIIKVYWGITVSLLLFTMLASLTGLTENLVYQWEGRNTRISFGIIYPTDFAAHVFFSVLGYWYLRQEKMKYIEIGLVAALGAFVYLFCEARFDSIMLILTAAVMFYHRIRCKSAIKSKKNYEMQSGFSALLAMSTTICAAFMIIGTIIYTADNKFLATLNKIVSYRFSLAKRAIDIYGFRILGQQIELSGNGTSIIPQKHYFFIDSSYLQLSIQYGLIVLGLILLAFLIIGCQARKTKNWVFLWIIALVSVQCMIEHHILSVAYNPFIWAVLADITVKTRDDADLQQSKTRNRRWKAKE